MTFSATSTTAPSTQPPDTEPAIAPISLTAIFVPGGRGADLRVLITVATATRSPSRTQLSASSNAEFTGRSATAA